MFPLPFLVLGGTQCPRQAASPSPSLLRKSTSPKGRGLGKEMKFAGTAKGSPFGRAGALAPERASQFPGGRQSLRPRQA